MCYSGPDVPDDIRVALIGSLFGTLPIFAGGVLNTIAVSIAITMREPTPAFIAWVVLEVLLCGTRLVLLVAAHRASRRGQPTYTDVYLLLGVLWGASVGYGAFISILSTDWIAATLSCLSAAAMVGGICFRNFGAPRLVAIMILLSLGPCCIAAAMSKELILTSDMTFHVNRDTQVFWFFHKRINFLRAT
ncbi:diguanylate cyclase/phosphodiesterase (GGDEF & EAL protein) with PAS/PAC sensor(s) [Caballeronia sordidicola]|uniref:Diguanylate cyclase/phosphodiesterase (GGDEF & EAL protein) with PAS/PAC sensor(S) n=1 Tax=Caballeronia sordidicola TaxID=196367 RepID=A0A242MPN5_CABSO|nr:diguanylate cyclase/phosphodiesterase (GGDEF & EAL protein) with PAS/PAC sensor(s) [Caballeronia sordidicola]